VRERVATLAAVTAHADAMMERLERRLNRSLRELGFELVRGGAESFGFGTTPDRSLRNSILRALAKRGYGVRRKYDADVPAEVIDVVERVRPYTMTSPRTVVGLCEAVEYLERSRIGGAFVECGVWRGGSMMAAALTLLRLGGGERDLNLFDTFAGMPMPEQEDVPLTRSGLEPMDRWQRDQRSEHNDWAYAPIEAVRENLSSTGYPQDRVRLVKGPVEETIPAHAPESIALLRLDTDWYSSTRHELEHLYPRLVPGGVLIIDDYGSWAGARKAVQEYAAIRSLFLGRLDGFARIAVKPGPSVTG
jgi:O-methyltransferase